MAKGASDDGPGDFAGCGDLLRRGAGVRARIVATQIVATIRPPWMCEAASWGAAAHGHQRAVDWRLGLALFTAATVDGTADLVLQNALCTLLERQDQWQRSLRFDTEQDMDLVAGACLLSACARGKLWAEALSTAQRLRSAGLEGNAMLGTSALTALEDHWRWVMRLAAHRRSIRDLRHQGLGGKETKRSNSEQPQAMQHRRSSPTLVSSLTVAGACQRCGQWRQALLALHQADADVTTFHARMTAALHSTKERVGEDSDGVLKEAWRSSLGHLLLLQAATLRKDLVTLNLGLAALGAGQRLGS
eukprot:g31583.t1